MHSVLNKQVLILFWIRSYLMLNIQTYQSYYIKYYVVTYTQVQLPVNCETKIVKKNTYLLKTRNAC